MWYYVNGNGGVGPKETLASAAVRFGGGGAESRAGDCVGCGDAPEPARVPDRTGRGGRGGRGGAGGSRALATARFESEDG